MSFKKYLLATALVLALSVTVSAETKGWLHVHVDTADSEQVRVNLPLSLVATALPIVAEKGMDLKQFDKAIYLIEQSEINSELAIEKSRTAVMRAKVADSARENEILREDFEATFGEDFR